jgi:glycosyltransferase involved in cell wall biosynthesis
VNPHPNKGVFVFARIAHELAQRRPEIPLLVVEGRSQANWLARSPLDLSGLKNLNVMTNTPDPRDFYRVTRIMLMPSLWNESFGRVAAESLINGIPVLASKRGALSETLAETLAETGFLFDIPARYTPHNALVPTPEEVAPWVETILRLWDDRGFYENQRLACQKSANKWSPDFVFAEHDRLFRKFLV